jgi:hypothetical protein
VKFAVAFLRMCASMTAALSAMWRSALVPIETAAVRDPCHHLRAKSELNSNVLACAMWHMGWMP